MTKRALASSLKKFMEKRPLNKISVREIVEDCGVNRKTFYYHFSNIYDLVRWMFEEEAIEVVKQYDLITDYKDAILFVMNYVEKNNHICNCALDGLGRNELKHFFQKDFLSIVGNIVEQLSENMDVPSDYKIFIINFYTEALAALLISWIQDKDHKDKEDMVKYISITLYETIKQALKTAEREL
ncbi:TetR family transcriptional regulator [Senegalia massiliensis]|jgi:probable dihydroxyacetone kinase regulator|uniref:TetR family transcriptional regulator n=2 Tax=Senegalia massiliensis TaxID=1720316 RepID=A0A845QUN1_9CLOT|nr:TetR family transcriptional regulator [Senegalia massiliensis]